MLDSSGNNSRVSVGDYIAAREEVRMVATNTVVTLPDKIAA